LLAGPEGGRGGRVLEIPQDVACAEIRTQPYLRCHPEPCGGLPADRGGRQALIGRELANCHGQFLVVHLQSGVKAGACPQQGKGEIVKLVGIGDGNGRGVTVRAAPSRLPAVDGEEPWPFWRLAGGNEQATGSAAAELLPPEQVLDRGQGAVGGGLGVVKLKLKYRSLDGPVGREHGSKVDTVVRMGTG
jgi:hypothetical protein